MKFAVFNDLFSRKELGFMPDSTFYALKNAVFSDIIGIDRVDPSLEEPAKLAVSASRKIFKTLVAFVRIKQTLIRVLTFSGDSLHSLIKILASRSVDIKKLIVNSIQRVSKVLPLKQVCRFFSVSLRQFYSWKQQLNFLCHNINEFIFCPSLHPNSVSPSDLRKMKSILKDPFYKGWPLYSVAMHALRNNKLALAVSTWYKYVKQIGFHSLFHKKRRKPHYKCVRASKPNEILHADITLFKNLDGSVSYIYFVMDNFSRYILSWTVDTCVSADTFVENLKKAFSKIKSVYKNIEISIINLITDGGPENDNFNVKEFVEKLNFHHFIAQKDIICSNSMIEAFNKTMKYS
ncbi:MAG: transposase, partial [Bacteroidetes bacterium]